ncbi:hypothetical protein C6V08_23840 [Burkholderia gladioli]|nr:hypothetical protein C6V08_23840 [Burkholderia gladioli]
MGAGPTDTDLFHEPGERGGNQTCYYNGFSRPSFQAPQAAIPPAAQRVRGTWDAPCRCVRGEPAAALGAGWIPAARQPGGCRSIPTSFPRCPIRQLPPFA